MRALLLCALFVVSAFAAVNPPQGPPPTPGPSSPPAPKGSPCVGRLAQIGCSACINRAPNCQWDTATKKCAVKTDVRANTVVIDKTQCPDFVAPVAPEAIRNPTVGYEWEFKSPKLVAYGKVNGGVATLDKAGDVCKDHLIVTSGKQGGRHWVDITRDMGEDLATLEIVSAPIQYNDEKNWAKVHSFIAGFFEHANKVAYDNDACKIGISQQDQQRLAIDPLIMQACIASIDDIQTSMAQDPRFADAWAPVLKQAHPMKKCGVLVTKKPDSGFPQINIATKVPAWGSGAVLPFFQFGLNKQFTAGDGVAKDAYTKAVQGISAWLDTKDDLKAHKDSNLMKGLWALFIYSVNSETKVQSNRQKYSGPASKNVYDLYNKSPLNQVFAKATQDTEEGKAVKKYWDKVKADGQLLTTEATELNTKFCSDKAGATCTALFKSMLIALYEGGGEVFVANIPKPVAPFDQDGMLCILAETRTGNGALELEHDASLEISISQKQWNARFKAYAAIKEKIGALP